MRRAVCFRRHDRGDGYRVAAAATGAGRFVGVAPRLDRLPVVASTAKAFTWLKRFPMRYADFPFESIEIEFGKIPAPTVTVRAKVSEPVEPLTLKTETESAKLSTVYAHALLG